MLIRETLRKAWWILKQVLSLKTALTLKITQITHSLLNPTRQKHRNDYQWWKYFHLVWCVAYCWHHANDNFSKYSSIDYKIFALVSFLLGVHINTKGQISTIEIFWGHTSTYKYLFIQSHYQPISIHPTNISIFPLRAVKLKHLGQGSCQGPLHGKLQNKRSLKIFLT